MITIEAGGWRVVRIDPEQVDSVLDAIGPLLSRTVRHTAGQIPVASMIDQLRQGWRDWMLWVIQSQAGEIAGAFIITAESLGQHRIATFELLAGVEAQDWIAELFPPFEAYLSQMWGITHVRIVGRRGWERFVRRQGFEASHFITSKRLVDSTELQKIQWCTGTQPILKIGCQSQQTH